MVPGDRRLGTIARRMSEGSPRSRREDRRRLLERIYGPEVAAELVGPLERLIDEEPSTAGRRTGWDETDVWLIAYPDQFRRPGDPPLRVLDEFHGARLSFLPGLHVLPFHPWSSDDGFAVCDYERVDPRYGDWEDLERIGRHRRLMVDGVVNHMSVESDWFARFLRGAPGYERRFRVGDPHADLSRCVRPRTTPLLTPFERPDGTKVWVWTTFGPDQADFDYREPSTLLAIVEVLLRYARRGAGVIRLDAVGFLWKEEGTTCLHRPETHDLVRLFRAILDDTHPEVLLVTETNVPHDENVRYFGDGTMPEAQLVYQFPLPPLVLHAVLTGRTDALVAWAADLEAPPPGTSFLNFLASHDGIGLRPLEGLLPAADVEFLVRHTRAAGGEVGFRRAEDGSEAPYELDSTWFDLMAVDVDEEVALARHLASHAVMLALGGVAAIYVHSLFASSNDQEGYRRSGIPRRLNRRRFDVDDLVERLDDPRSRPARALGGIRRLVRLRSSHPAFHPEAAQRILDLPSGLFGVERIAADGRRVRVVVNLGSEEATVDLGGWRRLADGGAPFGTLAGYEACWLVEA
ncbi:MAG TPA: DUF3459 domain-containing protein [Actinobacteria bacterium]|nr:DUF3459 domain-containing protein [Actinomycetota bacterium]